MGDEGAKNHQVPRLDPKLFSKHWDTVIELRTAGKVVRSTPVKYNRGLFQSDSLSPLLFCPAIAPISQVLNRRIYPLA